MKKVFLVVILALAVVSIAGTSEAVLINYDGTGFDYPTQILGYYSGLAGSPVHSSGFMWLDYFGSVSPTYGPHSLTAMAFSFSTNPVSIDWTDDVHNVNFWYGYNYPLSVQGYNNGSLVFNSGVLPQNSNGMFQYTAPDVSIDSLVFNGTADYWTMDDLSYEVGQETPPSEPVVPEPLSISLFGSGLLGLMGLKRKKI